MFREELSYLWSRVIPSDFSPSTAGVTSPPLRAGTFLFATAVASGPVVAAMLTLVPLERRERNKKSPGGQEGGKQVLFFRITKVARSLLHCSSDGQSAKLIRIHVCIYYCHSQNPITKTWNILVYYFIYIWMLELYTKRRINSVRVIECPTRTPYTKQYLFWCSK